MRNHSSGRPGCWDVFCPVIALAALSAISSPALFAQCSQADPDSIACQMQQPVDASTQASESPAVFSLSSPLQGQPQADRSNEASASGSLPSGSSFTESRAEGNPRAQPAPGATPLPPQPPTEFQRFVEATTGQMLQVFGAALFSSQRTWFGPVENAPAPENLIIGPGDELRIHIWGQVNFSDNLRVSREGEIYLPKAGTIHVAGLPIADVQNHLRQALDRIYRNYEITVDLGEIHAIQIYVAGEARLPGEYTVSALSTLIDALFASGGPSGAGSMRHVELKRGGAVLTDFDLYTLLVKGDKTGDVQLQPGDVLYLPVAGPQVALLGSVRQPGIYELRGEGSLASVLDAAGGRTAMAQEARISIDRIERGTQRRAFEVSGDDEGLDTPLADGDIVRIDAIASDYRDTVTMRGSIANPGRFRWHPGMRLSELMPDRDSLVTRGYWWRRTQLGLPAPEFVASSDQPASQSVGGGHPAGGGITSSGGGQGAAEAQRQSAVHTQGAQTNWDYAVIERLDPATMKTSLLSFNLGRLVLDHDSSQDRELMAGDVITVFSEDDLRPPLDRQTKYVRLDGEIVKSGVYSVAPGETLRSLVIRAGGLTSRAYLYGAEFTRKSTQELEQQRLNEYADRLEHLMERNALVLSGAEPPGATPGAQSSPALSINRELVGRVRQMRATGRIVLGVSPGSQSAADLPEIPLEDGDRLVVPSIPSTIQVIGAVFNQNAFLYRRGARVSGYYAWPADPAAKPTRRRPSCSARMVPCSAAAPSNRSLRPTILRMCICTPATRSWSRRRWCGPRPCARLRRGPN